MNINRDFLNRTADKPTLSQTLSFPRRHPLWFLIRTSLASALAGLCNQGLTQVPLDNGENRSDILAVDTTNSYAFTVNAGDAVLLRAGSSNFFARIVLYGPDSVQVGTSSSGIFSSRDAELSVQATNSGTFTVALSSYYPGGSGTCTLRWLRFPAPLSCPPATKAAR